MISGTTRDSPLVTKSDQGTSILERACPNYIVENKMELFPNPSLIIGTVIVCPALFNQQNWYVVPQGALITLNYENNFLIEI